MILIILLPIRVYQPNQKKILKNLQKLLLYKHPAHSCRLTATLME
jgi:hypothetical protein